MANFNPNEPTQDPLYQGDDWGSFDGEGSFDDDWSSPSDLEDTGEGEQTDFSQPEGGFIPPSDDGWGNVSGMEDPMQQQQFVQNPNDFASSEADIQEFQPRQVNLSMKKVAFIILAVGILLALIFLGLDKLHIVKKPAGSQGNTPSQVTQQPEQQGNSGVAQNPGGNDTQTPVVDSVTLVEIPETTQLDYNSDVLQANGKVINKLKYVQGHQVLYCINIGIAVGSSTETVSYYCNYSSYSAVSEGDIVVLSYQQVNDSYISVISISK